MGSSWEAHSRWKQGPMERAVRGINLRADEHMAKRLLAKGKHKEAAAALKRVERHRELSDGKG